MREKLLLVGVGQMGSRMARLWLDGGFPLTIWDIDEDTMRTVAVATGATVARSLREAAASTTLIVTMLPDSNAVESVLTKPGGVLGDLQPGTTVIDMGSSRPHSSRHIAGEAAKRGVSFVDAPVSGGVARAETGDLTVMFGGDASVLERCRALLSLVGSAIVHVGPVGAGHAMKALNNLMSAVGLLAAAEAITVGTEFGIDPKVMLSVLNTSTGRNHATEVKYERYVLSGSFDSGFALGLMVKDVTCALDLAHDLGVGVPLSAACLDGARDALVRFGPDADHTMLGRLPAVEERVR